MELLELRNRIIDSFNGNQHELLDVLRIVEEDRSIFPFNEYEHLICSLINTGGLNYNQYLEIRSDYIRQNPNLWIFEISAPRGFGEGFAQTYIQGMCPSLQRPSKKIDPLYSGQYDLYLDGIKIEVKASRAVDRDSNEPLYMKAVARNTNKNFLMNFQQLKPQYCHVFLWLAVFRDQIVIWVMNSQEVSSNPYYSQGQHRGNIGNEGQLHVTNENMHVLASYELGNNNLGVAIQNACGRLR